ncbi:MULTISPECIES: hypothetical protein [Sphingobacterium]|uniref:Lipoprotein n=1 Tax=Sphingobacterium athyrii TaxID=2152717 RepID=A0A363P0B1_9SPHI|nr:MULTISPECIES: hypothetical protein [Sphingobacterium]PUV26437.1 hypothetical protein DCO56_05705 [Sphingobacterium athyrii]QIH32690.1 hypothetical protein G6053_07175 [Sphingobacterium sp. DR205]
MKRIIILTCILALIIGCTSTGDKNESINRYWKELTTAQSNQKELKILEEFRVYLSNEHISYEVFGEHGKDSLLNLITVPNSYTPESITMKFYYEDKIDTKHGWKPKDPNNAFYLFNE